VTQFFEWSEGGRRRQDRYQDRFGPNTGELPEMETSGSAKDPMIIAFKIPEAPYSNDRFERIHQGIELVEAVHASMEIFAPELMGLAGIAAPVLAPVAAMLGNFMQLGLGYAGAREKIATNRLRAGFRMGVVTGASDAKWAFVKRTTWENIPEENAFYPEGGKLAQNSYNTGLAAGFVQGRQIARNPQKKKFFWDSIAYSLAHDSRDPNKPDSDYREQYIRDFQNGDSKSWTEDKWHDYYLLMSLFFDNLYMKR
jgi:hypothetical protein